MNKGKPKVKPRNSKGPYNSKREWKVMMLFNKILPNLIAIDNGFYSWLKSPHGSPMQLDRYYPELKLAIEVDGRQHVQYSTYFHSSIDAFEHQKRCDKIKNKVCNERGIKLIRIRYDMPLNLESLLRRLRRVGITVPSPLKGE